jgi:hypothetical protein
MVSGGRRSLVAISSAVGSRPIVFAMLHGDREIDSIGGIELGAVPIVVAITGRSWPTRAADWFCRSKEKKGRDPPASRAAMVETVAALTLTSLRDVSSLPTVSGRCHSGRNVAEARPELLI